MSLDPALESALRDLVAAEQLLVALDFDGTLAPEVDDPLEARALPEAQTAILALHALPRTEVALVSGRALDSLGHVGRLPAEVPLVGSHGVELRFGDGAEEILDPEEQQRRARLQRILDAVAGEHEGCWVEHKPAGFALHTRLVAPEAAESIQAQARAAVEAELPGLTERLGKNVLEFALRDATKGDGLRRLREHLGADAVLYAGDDVTDEDGFAALAAGDLAIKVGAADTRAAHRVADPAAMAVVLTRLVELRSAAVGGAA